MILYQGKIYEDSFQENLLNTIYDDCLLTLKEKPLDSKIVIDACDTFYKKILEHQYDDIIIPILEKLDVSETYFQETIKMISREGLEAKLKNELGDNYNNLPPIGNGTKRKYSPLGILFHIAAGNADVLPAFSIIEGLLVGNINILKLPAGDSGVSITLLNELISIEPLLKSYIYIFDIPSADLTSIQKILDFCNGVVVWGGDEVNRAVRNNAPINTKIISWGHKLSFAYVTKNYSINKLESLAEHICQTNQVLCSSCQGIYFDTNDFDEAKKFGELFFDLLKKANKKIGREDIGMIGRNTFQLYSKYLEEADTDVILNGEGVSVVVKENKELELSFMFRNVWVKPLPREEIINVIHKNREHLQSVALICSENEKDELANILISSGVVRVTSSNPSRVLLNESHDGDYALRRYTKLVEID